MDYFLSDNTWWFPNMAISENILLNLLITAYTGFRRISRLSSHFWEGYQCDPWWKNIPNNKKKSLVDNKLNISLKHGLLFIGQHLVIPQHGNLREHLFHLAHDSLGHFRVEKSYAALRDDFYWLNMRKNLLYGYIPSCQDCQHNKSTTHKPAGPLHPLPIPNN